MDSVLSQTFTDWEAICVNDDSPDKCGDILKKYAQKDNRIKVMTQENLGVSIARNNALEHTQGDYICFLDSDDELAPEFLEKILDVLAQHNADIVSCSIQQGEEKRPWTEGVDNVKIYSNPFEDYMQGKINTYAAIWGKLYKKEILQEFI